MASGRLLIPSWMPALDSDGNPIAGVKAYFYVNLTTTLAPIYSNEALTTPLTNPVEANSSGRFPAIWADGDVLYSVAIEAPYGPAGVPFSYDNLSVSLGADIATAEAAEAAADDANAALASTLAAIETATEVGGGSAALAGALAGATAGTAAGAAAAIPAVQNVIIDITQPPYNAVADYNPATGTWTTDNSAAIIAAIGTGREILAPAGNFFVLDSAAHRLLERFGYSGPGRIYGGWLDGQNYAFGDVVVAGEMLPFGGDRRRGGVLIGGDKDPYGDGSLLSASEMGGPLFQPTYFTTNELNIYALIVSGTGVTVNGTDRVTFTDGSSLATGDDLVEVGDIIGFGVQGYKISAIDGTGFNVTTESGGSVVFSGAVENHFRWSYKISRGYCDTNGTAVTWNRGQYFFSFFYGSAFQRLKVGGTWRAVNAITSAKALTLATSAGVATNTPYIMKSFFRVAAGVRVQSIFGGKEEAGFIGLSYHGRLEYDAQGYAGGAVTRKTPHSFGGTTQFDGNTELFATNITADGKVGMGEDFDILLSSPARVNAKVQNATAMGAGVVRNTLARLRSLFAGDLRFVDFFFVNDFSGVNIQSRTGSGVAGTRINPEGGNVSVGTTNASSPLTVAKGGSVGVAGVGLLVDLGSGEVLRDIKFGAPGSGPGGAGRMLWADN